MKTIIAGSRTINSYAVVERAIKESGFQITEVVCGKARGVDYQGEKWGKRNGIPIKSFHADWAVYGKAAGGIRNARMAEYAEALVAVWDGFSRGTAHMIKMATARGLRVYVLQHDAIEATMGEENNPPMAQGVVHPTPPQTITSGPLKPSPTSKA